MSSIKELMDIGKSLGLADSELRAFVKEEQERERQERLEARQAEKDRLDAERLAKEAERQAEKDRLAVRC